MTISPIGLCMCSESCFDYLHCVTKDLLKTYQVCFKQKLQMRLFFYTMPNITVLNNIVAFSDTGLLYLVRVSAIGLKDIVKACI